MDIQSEQLFTNVKPSSVGGKIIQFPLTRFIIAVLFLVPISLLFGFAHIGNENATVWKRKPKE